MKSFLFFSIFASLFGCACRSGGALGNDITFSEEYFPKTWKSNATLNLAGIKMDCTVSITAEGVSRVLKLISDKVVVEEELYSLTTDGLILTRIGPTPGESFEPGIPILKFPSSVGDSWTWSGKIKIVGRSIEAEAEIKTRSESVRFVSGQANPIVSEINLKLNDGSPTPAQRRLTIWVVKGEGPVKRDFGNQIREPR